jgi:hypothetical protein
MPAPQHMPAPPQQEQEQEQQQQQNQEQQQQHLPATDHALRWLVSSLVWFGSIQI